MLQRIQTLYLLLAANVNSTLVFLLSFGVYANGKVFIIKEENLLLGVFLMSAFLAVVAIFMYKNRKNQFVINRLNMILNLFLLGVFVYRSLSVSGEAHVSEKGVGMLLPVISIVLLVLANKAIKKDEELVKSVDRLR
ncbi:DUF4293 domain-containing protein [Sungkyunkwania multivorans]|uniref:DUF4293 domain-containing protein n=1 Tax=Sungkyunkwania multivorans TaxID=1173618 RepID=A0ABW3CSA3_9FLAO